MRIIFTMDDTTSPLHGLDITLKTALDLSLDDTADVLRALGWRLADFRDHQNRMIIAGEQRRVEASGRKIQNPVEITSDDEIVGEKMIIFASLRAAGRQISWAEVGRFKAHERQIVFEPGEGSPLAVDTEDETDPTPAATAGSTPAVVAAPSKPTASGRPSAKSRASSSQ